LTVVTKRLSITTKAEMGFSDITDSVQSAVDESGLKSGVAVVFCPGSTGAVSSMEYEPGLVKDIPEALERLAPRKKDYHHHMTWHDDNGSSHVKSAVLGPDLTVPFTDGRLDLGQWQQIVFIECDTRDRRREILVKVMGE
jgi:secondary thiamine-phosphate synthase enzyme